MTMTTAAAERSTFEGWAILELMGHRKLAGYVREQEEAGAGFLRIDVPGKDGDAIATQFYSPSSVYCFTPTTEELARKIAISMQPAPVSRWELPAPARSQDVPPFHARIECSDIANCPLHQDPEADV